MANIREELGKLEDNKLYSFSDISGLNGYQNQFIKQGTRFIPVQGDASQYGAATQLNFGAREIMPLGYGVTPQSLGVRPGQTLDQANQAYTGALNDTTTPRSIPTLDASGAPIQGGSTQMSGTDALASQNATRAAYNAETNRVVPYGYQENAQDLATRQRLAQGIPIGQSGLAASTPNTNRNLISATPKAGYIKGYDTNDGYKEVYVPAGKYVPGVSLYPKPSGDITGSSFTKEGGVTVPGASGDGGAGAAGAMVAGANASIAEIIRSLTVPQTETEKKQQSLLDQMTALVGENAKKAADQLTAEQSAGLPQLRQRFAEINGQILTKSAEYNALQVANANKTITMSSIIGNERAILNAKAADIGLLTAQAMALQGQISTAQETVNRAVDLKYSTIAAQLDVYQAQLNALAPTLNKEEKIQAQAQQIWLDTQKQALVDAKQTEKDKTNYVYDMMGKYGDAGILPTDSFATIQTKIKGSKIYQDQVRAPVGSGGGSTVGTGAGGTLTDYDILAEAVSNKLGSVAAKNSFKAQYAKAKTDEDKIKILAANVVLPNTIKNGIIQNTQVTRSLDDVLAKLDGGIKTGLLKAGQSYIANKVGSGADKQIEAIKSKLITAVQPYRNKITGAAWGTQEEAEYQALLGSVKFSPEDLKNKLNIFKSTLREQSQAALLAGIDPLGAINQNSVIQTNQNLTTPLPTVTTQEDGWWTKLRNWFAGGTKTATTATNSYDSYLNAIK